jgi:4-phytase/acid phosphatase
MRRERVGAAIGLLIAALPGLASATPELERVVLVSRHGVRAPTQTLQALDAATGLDWPAWPVGPGELTPHGAKALGQMGGFLRGVYVREGVLPARGCAATGAVQVWADGGDSRTRLSGDVLASALAPGCGVVSAHGPDGARDPLFDAAGTGVCPIEPAEALAALAAETHDGADLVRVEDRKALAALQTVMAPSGCNDGKGPCLSDPSAVASGKAGVKLTGPLALASTWSENLLLEYAQGFSLDQVGWGRAGSPTVLAAILPAHDRAAALLRQTPYFATHNGAVMARTVLDLLEGQAPADPHAPRLSPQARLTMIAGHDTNLSNMAGVFGLSWTLPDQPDATAPDTVLAFELWRDGDLKTVRMVVYSQSLAQLRDASTLDAENSAGITPVASSVCADDPGGVCRLEALEAKVRARLPVECFKP